jgi:hypothetical protein
LRHRLSRHAIFCNESSPTFCSFLKEHKLIASFSCKTKRLFFS